MNEKVNLNIESPMMCVYEQGLTEEMGGRTRGVSVGFVLFCFAFKVSMLKYRLRKLFILPSSNLHLPVGLNAKN